MTDTTHLMQLVMRTNKYQPFYTIKHSINIFSLVQSVADNETDVTVPGYIITETRYKIVDYTVPFASQGFYFWIKSSSVSIGLLNLHFSILCFQGIKIFMVFIFVANVQ